MRAAQAGAAVARARFGGETRRFAHAGVDFTTDADLEAERAIRSVLAAHRPLDAILGEEFGASGASARRWLVDPVCGTLNFAAGVPLFAVNVALEIDGVVAAAAVADPIARRVTWTDGERAWQRPDPGVDGADPDTHIEPSPSSTLVTVNLESDYPAAIGTRLLIDEEFRSRFSPRCFSTTLALSWVADGRQAAYVTGGDLRGSVHWAAGIALCRAAGAVVTNLAGGALHTGEHGLLAAADAETHAQLLAALESATRHGR
ncbi:myo-inositol-1(or 4)-monophosphatase [Agromyces sp. CF514]|uniref:inositol monophosphatase family protein n=1 Tax=Agromyces sp. CF514 TaxID=1881031 RepID=UPI0008EEBD1C|nr:inositol monophosphatase family protein [Agromyces sp. CF514]SFR67682.1 myo-inositol-1(or 4)-monophosphatase [Agromyces sp. CF514]